MGTFRAYISRIPSKWTSDMLREHMNAIFGNVIDADLFMSGRNNVSDAKGAGNICFKFQRDGHCPNGEKCQFSHVLPAKALGSGTVDFATQEALDKALAQGSLHVQKKTVKIQPFVSRDEPGARDTKTCFAWTTFACTRGDSCKFEHRGPGGCARVSAPFQGKRYTMDKSVKPCLNFRKKGRCSKGDECPYLHVAKAMTAATSGAGSETDAASVSKMNGEESGKRKRIDGAALVEMRKAAKTDSGGDSDEGLEGKLGAEGKMGKKEKKEKKKKKKGRKEEKEKDRQETE